MPNKSLSLLRAAGLVQRYHTWPTIKQQTVAEHTWQVLRIWFELYGEPSTDVAISILLHDAGELFTGDIPHATKRDNLDLKMLVSNLEEEYIKVMILQIRGESTHWPPLLSDIDMLRIKICDLLEMAEFGLDEITFGNRRGVQILRNVEYALTKLLEDHEKELEYVKVARERLLKIFALCNLTPIGLL